MEGEVQVKLPGHRGWVTLKRTAEPAPEVLETYEFNKTITGRRSGNPLFIPMLRSKSPHIWSTDIPSDVRSLDGKKIRVRYKDNSMRFRTTILVHI